MQACRLQVLCSSHFLLDIFSNVFDHCGFCNIYLVEHGVMLTIHMHSRFLWHIHWFTVCFAWFSAGSIYSIPEISRYLVLRKHDISYFRSFRYQFDRSLPSVFPVQKEKISKIITYIPTIKINVFCSRQIFMYQ